VTSTPAGRRLPVAIAVALFLLAVIWASPAFATTIVIWASPFADDSSHTHTSLEDNATDRAFWTQYMGASFLQDYNPTDLTTYDYGTTFYSWIDVCWYATPTLPNPAAAADYACMAWATGTTCEQARIRITEDARYLPTMQRHNLACHEIGHSVGFRDGADAGTSCMNGGNNGILTQPEINLINARY
jgi:hypothetical protein